MTWKLHRASTLGLLLVAALAAGCVENEKVIEPPPAGANDLLARYVALGNSITAGFQSAGINDSTQAEAYPVLLARMADVPFAFPAMAEPGCPAPYDQPLGGPTGTSRVGNPTSECAPPFRLDSPPILNNLAVPGATMAGLTDNQAEHSGANALTTFFLGGRTQADVMVQEQPTFVSVWAGNNDALGAVTSGDTTRLTPLADFTAALDALVAKIKEANPKGAALVGVVEAVTAAPVVQPGAFFFAAAQARQIPKPVDASCAPVSGNANAANFVSFLVLADPDVATIRCTADAPYVLTQPEIVAVQARVAAYNAAIAAAADQNGWIYIDPNETFQAALADPSLLRKCQGLLTGAPLSPPEFLAAVLTTCPGPTAPDFFGAYVSFDATHPSAAFHQAFADVLARAINQKYGTQIPLSSSLLARH